MIKAKPGTEFILASASPRRKALLESAGLEFKVIASNSEEALLSGETPQQMVERLAVLKAKAISEQNPTAWVIGCDTDVFLGNEVFGKPKDGADAYRMLSLLQGKAHSVWGAFAVLNHATGRKFVESHETRVSIATMSSSTMYSYVATGEPMDKAGAYAAQGVCAQFIERIEGSFTNVVGLNVCAFIQLLRQHGLVHDG